MSFWQTSLPMHNHDEDHDDVDNEDHDEDHGDDDDDDDDEEHDDDGNEYDDRIMRNMMMMTMVN